MSRVVGQTRDIIRLVMDEKRQMGWRFKEGAEDRACKAAEYSHLMGDRASAISRAIDAEKLTEEWEVT